QATSAWPMRPPAPATAVRMRPVMRGGSLEFLQPVEEPAEDARIVRGRDVAERALGRGPVEVGDRLRHLVALPARELVVDEEDGELAVLDHLAVARVLVHVVPAVVAERA